MVERLLRVFNREWSGLHEAAFLLAGTALLSQVLGLVRDRLLVHRFGAGEMLDIYYAAFRIPDFLYVSVASFVAVTVLIPFVVEKLEKNENGLHAQQFINTIFTAFTVVMVLVGAVVYISMPYLAQFVVPGFSSAARDEFIVLSRILLLSPLLLGISNLFGAVTQSLRRFFVFAAGPVLYNTGILFGIIVFLPSFGLSGVAYGVILGALLHVLIQLPVLIKEGILPHFTSSIHWGDIVRVTKLSIPRTLGLSAMHLAAMVLIALASQIEEGAIAVFVLAMNLQSISLSIIGMSYSVAAFPTLAKLWTGGNREEFLLQIITATRHILFWSFPAIVLFIVLRAQIVRTILGSGAFDWTATRLTAAALALFVVSIVAQNLVLLYTRSFYAMGKTRMPLFTNVVGAFVAVLSAVALLYCFERSLTFRFFAETLLRVSDISGTAVLMLPLAYSLGMIVNVLLLLFMISREFPRFAQAVKQSFLQSFIASVAMGFFAYHALQVFSKIFDLNTFLGIFLQGFFAGLLGIVLSIFLLRMMNNRELDEIRSALHLKFWKAKPLAAEQEGL